jgi:type IV secretory pathway VirB10-like protein
MQPNSSAPPPHQPSARPAFKPSGGASPQTANTNEFAEAVARMFEKRQHGDGAPVVLPRLDPPEEGDDAPSGIRGLLFSGGALRRALAIVPLAVVGFSLVWFFYPEPSQDMTPAPAAKAEVQQPVEAAAPAPPPRPAVVEPPPPAPPPPAATPAVAPPQSAPPPPDLRPLTREEIKELQGKLGAIGFAAGPVDGVVGPQTQAALRRYSEARSLPSAEANREVLSRVRVEASAKP